jgi:hypothetical protein
LELNTDLIVTPESIRIECRKLKRELKLLHIRGKPYQFKNKVECLLPAYVNKLRGLKGYCLFEEDITLKAAMRKSHSIRHSEADTLVKYYGQIFTEIKAIISNT